MIDTERLTGMIASGGDDTFSLTLNTDPSLAESQRPNPGYRVWTHTAVEQLLGRLSPDARRRAEPAAGRILAYVDEKAREGRGLAVFAGPDLWQAYTLPFPLPNHLAYGKPDAVPLLWALREYAPYAAVLAFHDHAQLLVFYLGRTPVVEEIDLELNTAEWRFKTGRPATASRLSGTGVGRGLQPAAFDARVLAQHRRFWREVARAAARMLAQRGIDRVVIGGNKEAAAAVSAALPRAAGQAVVGTVALRPHAPLAEVEARTRPLALAHRQAHDRRLVRAIANDRRPGGPAVQGIAATLDALAAGALGIVVVSRDMHARAWMCSACGATGMTAARCAACGGATRPIVLPADLPMFAARHGAALEVVDAGAAKPLADGIGGLRRYPAAAGGAFRRGA